MSDFCSSENIDPNFQTPIKKTITEESIKSIY